MEKNQEDIAIRCICELLDRSFLEFDPHSSQHIKMHDVNHDLALYVSNGECGVLVRGKLHRFSKSDDHLRHLYYNGPSTEYHIVNPCSLRMFTCWAHYKDDKICAVKNMVRLRALAIINSHCGVHSVYLNFDIGNLKHLRFLRICGGRNEQLSESICHLCNLHTLVLNDVPIEVLPVEFGRVLGLRYCRELKQLPYSVGDLSKRTAFPMLKKMKLESCRKLKSWDGMLDGDFPQLENLVIADCYKLSQLPSIETWVVPDNFHGRYPSWVSDNSFTMLKHITLTGSASGTCKTWYWKVS